MTSTKANVYLDQKNPAIGFYVGYEPRTESSVVLLSEVEKGDKGTLSFFALVSLDQDPATTTPGVFKTRSPHFSNQQGAIAYAKRTFGQHWNKDYYVLYIPIY